MIDKGLYLGLLSGEYILDKVINTEEVDKVLGKGSYYPFDILTSAEPLQRWISGWFGADKKLYSSILHNSLL